MPKTLLFFFTGLLMFAQAAWAQDQLIGYVMNDPKGYIEIPFETHNNLIIIPITVEGVMTLRFILDTGVRNTIITQKRVADFIGLKYSRRVPIVGADGNKLLEAYVADDVSTNIGTITGHRQSMLVLEEDLLQLNYYLGTEVHGIIGYDLFDRFVIDINYDSRRLTIYEPLQFKPKRVYKALDIEIRDAKPYLKASVTQKDGSVVPVDLLIDSGASLAISLDENSHPNLYTPDPKVRASLGRGLGGEINGFVSRINRFNMGKFQFKEVLSSYPEENIYSEAFRSSGRNGSLGGNVLKRLHVIFDYRTQKMYVRKGREYRFPFEYNMTGIELMASGLDYKTLTIDNIVRNSPAERADFRLGDVILKVNNIMVQDLNLNLVNAFFRQRKGKTLRILILREGEILEKKIKLERII